MSNQCATVEPRQLRNAVSTIRPDISGGVGCDGDAIASNAISGQICDLTIRPWTFWLVTIRFPLRARFWRGWVATPIGLGRQTRSRMKSPQTCEILFHTGNLLGVRIAHHRQEVAARSSRCRFSKALLVVVRLARCSRRSDSMVQQVAHRYRERTASVTDVGFRSISLLDDVICAAPAVSGLAFEARRPCR